MSKRSVIVIGAGLMGVTTAYALQSRGYDVRILDGAVGPGLGTSFANGGMLTPSMADPWNGPGVGRQIVASMFDPYAAMKLRPSALPNIFSWGLRFLRYSTPERHWNATQANYHLAVYSLRQLQTLRDDIGLDFQSCDNGSMKIFETVDSMAHAVGITNRLSEFGFNFDICDGPMAVEHEPALGAIADKFVGAIYHPDDASGDAHKFTVGLHDEFQRIGGQSNFSETVRSLIIRNGQCIGVETENEEFLADAVTIAAGCGSVKLARGAGVSLSVKPVKGYSLTTDVNDSAVLPRMPVIHDAMHAAITPLGHQIRINGTAEITGLNAELKPARIENLRRIFKTVYPDLLGQVDLEAASAWCGFRPVSADGLPYIGQTATSGIWVNTGHGHLGWTLACGSAFALADLMDSKTPVVDTAPFSPVR